MSYQHDANIQLWLKLLETVKDEMDDADTRGLSSKVLDDIDYAAHDLAKSIRRLQAAVNSLGS